MAALAVPLIEAVGLRVLAALGVVVAGGAAGEMAKEQARKRREQADRVSSTPVARGDALTQTREKCPDCAPDRGEPFNRSTVGWSEISIAYQARVGGMPAGPGFITEWLFGGVNFDGFDSGQCLLKEAKARYDQFFDEFRQVRGWWAAGAETLIAEAYRQATAARPRPPVQLRWHFMEPISYRYFSRVIKAAYPDLEVVFLP